MQIKSKKYKKQLTKLQVEFESDESVPMKPKAQEKRPKYVHPGSESSLESASSDKESDDKKYSTPKEGPNQSESSSSSSDDDN